MAKKKKSRVPMEEEEEEQVETPSESYATQNSLYEVRRVSFMLWMICGLTHHFISTFFCPKNGVEWRFRASLFTAYGGCSCLMMCSFCLCC